MRSEPPTGDELTRMLVSMKRNVLEQVAAEPAPQSAKRSRSTHRILGLGVGVTLLLGVGAGAAFALGIVPTSGDDTAAPVATATATPTPDPSPTTAPPPTTEPPVQIPVGRIPHTCEEIYTRDLTPEFHGLTLNPEWTDNPNQWGARYFDDEIDQTATSQSAITCIWAGGGPNDRGLFTNIAYISPFQMIELPARLQQLGQACYEELQGVRCVYETDQTADGNAGESHFFRDGIWIATHWINAGPDGYTHDIVTALFG